MLTGFSLLQLFGYYLKMKGSHMRETAVFQSDALPNERCFYILNKVAMSEWDTLFFFYGVVICVGGLGFIGYLAMLSESLYSQWDSSWVNSAVGILSAI